MTDTRLDTLERYIEKLPGAPVRAHCHPLTLMALRQLAAERDETREPGQAPRELPLLPHFGLPVTTDYDMPIEKLQFTMSDGSTRTVPIRFKILDANA